MTKQELHEKPWFQELSTPEQQRVVREHAEVDAVFDFIRSAPVTPVEREYLVRIANSLIAGADSCHGVIVELSRLLFLRGISGSGGSAPPPSTAAPMLPLATPPSGDDPQSSDADARAAFALPDDPDDFDAWALAVARDEPTRAPREWIPDLYGPRWQSFAAVVRKAWSYRCGLCGCTDAPTEVHHNTYAHAGDERFFDVIPLCAPCHERHHGIVERVDAALARLFARETVQ